MSSEFSPELRKELLDDFYAECDELLTSVRDGLIPLNAPAAQAAPPPAAIESLFRSLHSLKGIAAIVGLRPAELLAHDMEDVLRALSKKSVVLTPAIVQLLLSSTLRVEQIVTAHRLSKPLPASEDLQKQLRQIAPAIDGSARAAISPSANETEPASDTPLPDDPIRRAREQGLQIWVCSFTPSPELDRRGININTVRERVGSLGQILKATPSVRGKGLIVFEFFVGLTAPPPDAAGWEQDGLRFALLPPASTLATPVSAAPTESAFTDSLSLTPSHIVRVDLARLDDLLRITGEMVIHRSRLEDRLGQPGGGAAGLKEISVALGRSLREMREAISRVRLVPIGEIFTRMQFVVSDLVRDSGKQVRIALEGPQTEVDKYLVEHLKEPLLHLVRNAVAHGIETAAERVAARKPAEATIRLRATSVGEFVKIQIADDGRGMDPSAIRARAVKLGLAVPERLDAAALLEVLCAPGFSTRDEADLAAGRGVGMAVVATAIRKLGGTVSLESTPGVGTEFTLRLPLSLSIADAIIVSIGTQICAVPQNAVDEIVQVPTEIVRTIKGTEVIPYRGGLLPFRRLSAFFKCTASVSPSLTLLVVSTDRGKTGVAVDRIHAQREIVIRPLSDPLLRVPGVSGATELGDGRPILILDPIAMTNGVVCPPTDETDLQLRAS